MSPGKNKTIVGWKEYVSFPKWARFPILAKSDSGAATSAIDVAKLKEVEGDRVEFELVTSRKHPDRRVKIETDIYRHTTVKSSNGQPHDRYVVLAKMQLGEHKEEIEVSLVCRRQMKCRMLIGRQALSKHFLVDSSKTFLLGNFRDTKRRLQKAKQKRR